MEFLEIFEHIDSEFTGTIPTAELVNYMRENGYDEEFVNKWLELFDAHNSGQITINDFCDTLGLQARDEYMENVSTRKKIMDEEYSQDTTNDHILNLDDSDNFEENITVIKSDDMDESVRNSVFKLALAAQDKYSTERDIARYIKTQLDKTLGRAWHVLVCRHSYGCVFSHEPGCMIQFTAGRFTVQLWKTSE